MVATLREHESSHTLGGTSDPGELDGLEQKLGLALPASYREFLERLGSGIFYERHEIFGPHRVMLHDIEFVPDLFTVRRLLEADGRRPAHGTIPVHRAGPLVHLLDLNPGEGHGRVLPLGGGETYPDFGSFLEAVVLSDAALAS